MNKDEEALYQAPQGVPYKVGQMVKIYLRHLPGITRPRLHDMVIEQIDADGVVLRGKGGLKLTVLERDLNPHLRGGV